MTRFPIRMIGFIVLVSGFGLFIDMAGWWITRDIASFAYAIVIGGALYAIGSGILGTLIMIDSVLPSRKPAEES